MTVLFIINSLFFLSFIAAFCKKVHNAGNIAGITATIVVYLFIFFKKQLESAIIRSNLNNFAWAVMFFCIFLIIFPLIVFSVVMTFRMMLYSFASLKKINFSDKDEFRAYKFIIVLGCRVKGCRPSRMLMQRINAAYKEYLKAPEKTFIIASGGKGSDEDISEAECIYNELVRLGVDKYRIYKEDKSTTTYENMKNSYCKAVSVVHSKEMYGRPDDNYYMDIYYVIVTNGFHMYRSIKLAEECGFKAYAAVAHTTFWLIPTYWIRELMALFKYYIVKRTRWKN